MQNLRNAKLIARFVLVWFALSIGVAIASPVVKPQSLKMVCSGTGFLKLIVAGDDGSAPSSTHTLDCPLCASTGSALPVKIPAFIGFGPEAFALPVPDSGEAITGFANPPPARGPPSFPDI